MPNGEQLNEQLEFEERIKAMLPDDRTVFIAKQVYTITTKFDDIDKKVTKLDGKVDNLSLGGVSKKTSAVSGGATGGIIAAIMIVVDYFLKR